MSISIHNSYDDVYWVDLIKLLPLQNIYGRVGRLLRILRDIVPSSV